MLVKLVSVAVGLSSSCDERGLFFIMAHGGFPCSGAQARGTRASLGKALPQSCGSQPASARAPAAVAHGLISRCSQALEC